MKNENFTASFLVDQTPEQVFAAVNDVRAWWSGEIDGRTDALGAEFTYTYKDIHRTTQRITEFLPAQKVVWRVIESRLSSFRDQKEWDGTEIVFEVARKGEKTELRFTHVGLVPSIQCYGDCSGAWSYLVNENLHNLITTGKASRNPEWETAASPPVEKTQPVRGARS